jgi:CubicO group peptidase (beta-lactamase class C family)
MDQSEFRRYYREISGYFDSTLLSKPNFNGGILVARNGLVIYEKYAGKKDLRKPDPMDSLTPMHIASVSKTFMSIAILRLVQENRLSLNDSVEKFYPGFPYHGITIRMLLSHRSGLPNYLYFMEKNGWDKKQYATNADVLQMLFTAQPQRSYPPDTHFSYCNTNFVLLALILEKVTGTDYPDFMQKQFFEPLSMNHTYVFTLKDTATATPSFTPSGTYWNFDFLDGTYGDKNIYSTPEDLLKWDQALYTGQVLRLTLLDSAYTAQSHERPSIHNYGLGWRLEILPNGKKVVYHYGKWHGFNAAFVRLRDEQATIIITGNRFTSMIYSAAHGAYKFFGDYLPGAGEDEENEGSHTPIPPKKKYTRKHTKSRRH